MMKNLPKLLQLLLAPFFLYVDDDGGGAADDGDSGADWAELNSGVAPGADDADDDVAVVAVDDAPLAPAAKPATSTTAKADNPDESTSTQDPVEANPEAVKLLPEDSLEPAETLTPEQIAARDAKIATDYAAWKQAQMATLQTTYSFDEETASRLQTEPELVLPELAAKMHMEIMESVVTAVQRLMPQMIPSVIQSQSTEKEAESLFFTAHPDLKGHKKEVMVAGKMYRQMNPKATKDQAIKAIGDIVRSTMGLAAPEAGAPPAEKPKGPAKPHRPAQAGSGSGVKPAPKEGAVDTLWDDLID